MKSDIKVPALPESVADALIVGWHKKVGEAVKRDEPLVDLETDKVVLEVPAPCDGILGEILHAEGETVTTGTLLGHIGDAGAASVDSSAEESDDEDASDNSTGSAPAMGPAARKLLQEHDLDPAEITPTGAKGRITKQDVLNHIQVHADKTEPKAAPAAPEPAASPAPAPAPAAPAPKPAAASSASDNDDRPHKRVPMTRLRARIAERLLDAKQNTAMLTTFNEVDMSAVMALRSNYKTDFEKSHNIRLGFMSFFVRAATEALKRYPEINASLDGNDIVYHGFCDIGVAVAADRGLVVPILRNTEAMSLAKIEQNIAEYSDKAQKGSLSMEEMTGGTFTITNGGVFGSLMSTPILNPPQSAILGMHSIQQRPIAENGEVVIRPMMYLALSYDHRIVDGKSAVMFLRTIKELLQEPARMLLDI